MTGFKARSASAPWVIERLNREELRTLLKEGGQISSEHQRMLVNILDLEHATVDDVMIPRQDIVGIDLEDDWATILTQLTQTLYTRMPVYRGSIDHVEGTLHIRSVISKLNEGGLRFDDLKRSIRSPYFIPEATNLMQQLLEFQSRERRMGLVVDEYGDIQAWSRWTTFSRKSSVSTPAMAGNVPGRDATWTTIPGWSTAPPASAC